MQYDLFVGTHTAIKTMKVSVFVTGHLKKYLGNHKTGNTLTEIPCTPISARKLSCTFLLLG